MYFDEYSLNTRMFWNTFSMTIFHLDLDQIFQLIKAQRIVGQLLKKVGCVIHSVYEDPGVCQLG